MTQSRVRIANVNGQIEIETTRLLLCATQASHALDLHKAFSDPLVMKYWSTIPHTTPTQTSDWLSKMISLPQNGKTDFIIVYENKAIGKIGIWDSFPPKGEIGFMIAREYWNMGLVSEALEALLPYYFDTMGYEDITADVDPENEASLHILEKFGFVRVGYREKSLQVGEMWVDSVDLSLTRKAFKVLKVVDVTT
jgi:ribosomal-protein-alanine N-acetyltransferase